MAAIPADNGRTEDASRSWLGAAAGWVFDEVCGAVSRRQAAAILGTGMIFDIGDIADPPDAAREEGMVPTDGLLVPVPVGTVLVPAQELVESAGAAASVLSREVGGGDSGAFSFSSPHRLP